MKPTHVIETEDMIIFNPPWDTVWTCPRCHFKNVMLDPFCKCGEWKPTPFKSGIDWIVGRQIRETASGDLLIVKRFQNLGALLECGYVPDNRMILMLSYSDIGEGYELVESASDLILEGTVSKSIPIEDAPNEDDYLSQFFTT